MQSVVIIDFGSGNLHSVHKALERVAPQVQVSVSDSPEVILAADRVVFPGQGAIGTCVRAVAAKGLEQAMREAMASKPFLGVCLGLQALFEFSEEDGGTDCLGIFSGRVRRFATDAVDPATGLSLKIPHMGWNQVHQQPHPLWQGIEQDARFYFVHSYYADSGNPDEVAGATSYGVTFTSAAARDNIFAVQFHPEKSQHAGLRLLENFVRWNGDGV
jgi:glutamine amidotransferase